MLAPTRLVANPSTWRLLAIFVLATGIAGLPPRSGTAAERCPSSSELAVSLEQRVAQLRNTHEHLQSFVSGNRITDIPPAALFVADLQDEAAVAKRVAELKAARKHPDQAFVDADVALLDCARDEDELASFRQSLIDAALAVNELRLQFLDLPRERRSALINAQQDALRHGEAAIALEQERASAEQVKQQAQESVAAAEELAKTALNSALRELASQRALLEKTREELAETHVRLTEDLQARTRYYQQTAEKLSALAGLLTTEQASFDSWEAYESVVQIWRELVDRIFERIADPASYEPLPPLPPSPEKLLERIDNPGQVQAYREAYAETGDQYQRLSELRSTRFDLERENLYRLLLQAGGLRSQLMRVDIRQGDARSISLSENYVTDIAREFRVVPYQFLAAFYGRLLDLRRQSSAGLAGWLYIAKQSLLLVATLAIPFAVYHLLRRLSRYLNRLRRALVSGEIRTRHAKLLAIWIQRLNPYVPWIVMLLGLGALKQLIAGSAFADLAVLLPFLALYLWYRIFLLLLSTLVATVARSGAMELGSQRKERIAHVARQIGIFFFTALAILGATEDVVGRALIHRLVSDIMSYAGTLVCMHAAWQWREEIRAAGEQMLPAFLARHMPALAAGWRSWLLSLPVLLLVIAAHALEYIGGWASEFDFVKRLGAELFRRRIETHAETGGSVSGTLPADYLCWFELEQAPDPAVFITPDNDVIETVSQAVAAWREQRGGEHCVAIYGDKGGGKTTLLRIMMDAVEGLEKRYISVPPKLHTREAALGFLGTQLGLKLEAGPQEMLDFDAGIEPTLILVDECHNLFLSQLGGFEGYRAFLELMALPTRNLFWCTSFNRRSWGYLNGVFGAGLHFRTVIPIPPLSEQDIRRLVMARHRQTSYRLVYDEIIRATQSDDDEIGVTAVETQFFRLLWGQANGNPRAAMALWLSSLRRTAGNRLHVGVPRYQPVRGLEGAGDDAWFVYATILRHENISVQEAMLTTNLPEEVVRAAIKTGLAANALAANAYGRFHFTSGAQFHLNQLLLRKNFIHE